MDGFFIIVIILYVLYHFICKKRSRNDSHLSETQRKWREYRQIEKIKTEYDQLKEHDRLEHGQLEYDAATKRTQMFLYISKHKRPFHTMEWLFSAVDSRLIFDYVKNMAIVLLSVIITTTILGAPFFVEVVAYLVLVIDLYMYHKQLILEVTQWNPEFCKKFPEDK